MQGVITPSPNPSTIDASEIVFTPSFEKACLSNNSTVLKIFNGKAEYSKLPSITNNTLTIFEWQNGQTANEIGYANITNAGSWEVNLILPSTFDTTKEHFVLAGRVVNNHWVYSESVILTICDKVKPIRIFFILLILLVPTMFIILIIIFYFQQRRNSQSWRREGGNFQLLARTAQNTPQGSDTQGSDTQGSDT